MDKNTRDTQFQEFAKLLMSELLISFGDFDDMERIIARRAYDLVCHAVFKLNCLDAFEYNEYQELHGYTPAEMIAPIPDMTEWPQEQE